MKVSVIIPVYNEANYITSCLKSLEKQTLQDFEIIVVDDGSSDGTEKRVKDFMLKSSNLKLLTQNHMGAGAARNLGASVALGDILVFVDGDMTFEKHFLKNLVRPIVGGKTNGTFSNMEYVANWDNRWSRCFNINEGWLPKRRHPKNYPSTQKVFRAILRSEFIKVSGFTPGGYTDDYSLSDKLGYLASNVPNAIFYHKNPETLSEVFGQAKWIARRSYKFGYFGMGITLIRTSLPFSLIIGTVKALLNKTSLFIVFKIVYDAGIFFGILHYVISGRGAK